MQQWRVKRARCLLPVFAFAAYIVSGVLATVGAAGPDFAREQRLGEQIIDAILDGEPVWLEDSVAQRKFLSIYMPAEDAARGTVILMHGRGMHPDWADTIAPLRVALTERGWNTLSIQMPVLPKGATYYDYVPIFPDAFPRIQAAIRYARSNGAERVVMFAHSCSVHMSMAFVDAYGDATFDAYIGAGMGATDYKQPMRAPFPLANMSVPILDIYGEEEFPAVRIGAPGRWAAFGGRHKSSRQQVLPGADHYFKDAGDALSAAVSTWLDGVDWHRGAQ